jgi:hypothetical protein
MAHRIVNAPHRFFDAVHRFFDAVHRFFDAVHRFFDAVHRLSRCGASTQPMRWIGSADAVDRFFDAVHRFGRCGASVRPMRCIGSADAVIGPVDATPRPPSSVVLADDGALWATEWGRGQVSRLFDGAAELVAELPGPVGLDRNAAGDVIVGASDGWIYTLAPDGAATQWAFLEEGAPADFAAVGDLTYATSLDAHRVWEIDLDGQVRILAGKARAGDDDGPLDEARLDSPNGIAVSPDGDRLFVQQLDKRLRVIHLR